VDKLKYHKTPSTFSKVSSNFLHFGGLFLGATMRLNTYNNVPKYKSYENKKDNVVIHHS
jgi:hypothetical protein